jgi:heme exporter protein C
MEKPSRGLQILNLVSAVLILIALGLVFFYAPEELVMGQVQRIFYFHVAAAWVGFLAFFVTVVAGVLYLRKANQKWDRVGMASVEIGLMFSIAAGAAGAIWARPIWNTWWTWDPRLTTYSIMALIYIAYLMLRQGIEDPDRRARFAAVYGIIGFISVPITYMSIRWWRTIHPVVIGGVNSDAKGEFAMTTPMVQTFLFALLAFTVLYFCFLFNRLRLARLEERVDALKAELMAA